MRRSRFPWSLRALSVAGILPLLLAPTPADTSCTVVDPALECKSTTSFSTYTGTPTVLCLLGHPVVQIVSRAKCQGQMAGPAHLLRCGVLSTPFSYSGGGFTHSFGTLSDWETVLWGACEDLVYTPTED